MNLRSVNKSILRKSILSIVFALMLVLLAYSIEIQNEKKNVKLTTPTAGIVNVTKFNKNNMPMAGIILKCNTILTADEIQIAENDVPKVGSPNTNTIEKAQLPLDVVIKELEKEEREIEREQFLYAIRCKKRSYDRYVKTSLNVREGPGTDFKKIGSLGINNMVHITGVSIEDDNWVRIKLDNDETGYVCSKYLSKHKIRREIRNTWGGQVLNRRDGTVTGPSGKETYYNLNMAGVINIMRSLGYNYNYWVREDGVKMYGDYIMVAANLNIRPKGTIVRTSLGLGMVCDTGTFARTNPTQLDIATGW